MQYSLQLNCQKGRYFVEHEQLRLAKKVFEEDDSHDLSWCLRHALDSVSRHIGKKNGLRVFYTLKFCFLN